MQQQRTSRDHRADSRRMTRVRPLLLLGAAWVLAALALGGCLLMGFEDDCWDDTTWRGGGARVVVEPWHSRIEYRVVLTITAEGASEIGDELRRASEFRLSLIPDGGTSVTRVGLSRPDGATESRVDNTISFENLLADCGEGECSRSFFFWADVSGGGEADAWVSFQIPLPSCVDDESRGWFRVTTEHLRNTPEAPPGETRP